MSGILARLLRLDAALARQGDTRLVVVLIGAFIASRLAFRAAGVRFFSESLDYFLQYLDPVLLRGNLAESLFYLHAQPPLFNLFLGVVLKTSPGFEREVFAACFFAVGLGSGVLLYSLLRGLRVSHLSSLSASLLFLLSPGAIAFENFLLYDLPVMALLLLAAVALLHFARGGRRAWLCMFALSLVALGFTRSMFHLFYLAGIAAVFAGVAGPRTRQLLAACAAAAVLLATLFVKNELVFDRFTSSTWLGMSLVKMTRVGIDDDRLRELHERGRISKYALRPPFEQLEVLGYPFPKRFRGVAALARSVKSTGAVNFNYIAYIEMSEQLGRDAFAMLVDAPDGYWNSQLEAWAAFFEPAGNATYQTVLLPSPYLDFWNRTVFGRLPIGFELRGRAAQIHLLLVAGVIASLVCGGAFIARKSWREALDEPERVAVAFMVATAAYVILLGNALDWGENYRTRLYIEPYLVAFLALGLRKIACARNLKSPGTGAV